MLRAALSLSLSVALLLIAVPSGAGANEYLEPISPEDLRLDGYRQMLHEVFSEALAPQALASTVIVPSFSPESAIALVRRGGRPEVVVLTPAVHLWAYETLRMMEEGEIQRIDSGGKEAQEAEIAQLRKRLPASLREVKVGRCSRKISASAADLIVQAWSVMLSDLRPNDEIILDGVSYEFFVPGTGKQGRANTPTRGRTRKLADLADALAAYCRGAASDVSIRRLAMEIGEPEADDD